MILTTLNKIRNIAAISITAMFLFTHCSQQPDTSQNTKVQNKDTTLRPMMYAYDVQSLVSDSGRLKIRLTTTEYQTFITDTSSFWIFPNGLFLERFTVELETDAEIICQYAKYFEKKEFWELRDSVVAKNAEDEIFETELLYWDQKKGTVYTDEYIQIIRPGKDTIEGFGFTSNQNFSKWEITNTNARFKFEFDE